MAITVQPFIKIAGRDITKYIEAGGISLSENDMDSPKSGRTLDAVMHRGKVAEKKRADIKLWPVNKKVLDWLMPLLRNQYFTVVTNIFPASSSSLTLTMYCSTRKYGISIIDTDGQIWYQGTSFNIIER